MDQIRDSTEVVPILRVLEWGLQLGVSKFCTNLGLNSLLALTFNNHSAFFFCGQNNLLGGQFWARAGLMVGQSNLLDEQMPT